jgi:hypothetical protein
MPVSGQRSAPDIKSFNGSSAGARGAPAVDLSYVLNGKSTYREAIIGGRDVIRGDITPTTTTLFVTAVPVEAGFSFSNVAFLVGSVGSTGLTASAVAVYDSALNKIATSTDQGATQYTAFQAVRLALTGAPFVSATDQVLYVVVWQVGTTPATLRGFGMGSANVASPVAPNQVVLCGSGGTAANLAALPATMTLTATGNRFYAVLY